MAGSTAAHEEDNVKLLFFFLWLQRGVKTNLLLNLPNELEEMEELPVRVRDSPREVGLGEELKKSSGV